MAKEDELIEELTRYYEVDLDNCFMTHEMWIKALAECMANPSKYTENFYKQLKEYEECH